VNGAGVKVSAVVPTLGRSPHLAACLEALRADGGDGLEIVVVAQGPAAHEAAALADVWLELEGNRGFTGGTNEGIAAAAGEWLATVNDDALVEPGWVAALVAALEADPGAAAAQGSNVRMDEPAVVDGAGLGWNRGWQAVQLGHGEALDGKQAERIDEEWSREARATAASPEEASEQTGEGASGAAAHGGTGAGAEPREVFGVSATAAVYRRSALAEVGLFDEALVSWYEDVDLATRLRAAGWRALHVPGARARHAGGATGRRRPWRYGRLLYANRWLAVARLLGRRFPAAVPRLLARDLADLARRPLLAPAITAGWLRALRHLPAFAHRGDPLVSRPDLRRFGAP
jgi:GT2 family glycosyltransferase